MKCIAYIAKSAGEFRPVGSDDVNFIVENQQFLLSLFNIHLLIRLRSTVHNAN